MDGLHDTIARTTRLLESGLRIAVVAREPALAARIARRLEAARPEIGWVAFPFAAPAGASSDPPLPDERLLGVHALIWATAPPSPFGEEERQALEALAHLGQPERRALVLVDAGIIDRISDEPEREHADVRARLDQLAPPGFVRLDEEGLSAWIASLDVADVARDRARAVEQLLVGYALSSAALELASEEAAVAEIDTLLAQEDDALAEAVREGSRVAAHVLGAVGRHGETLRIELKDFVEALARDLPAQITPIDDTDLVRRVLPHWVQHVFSGWLTDALARWRVAVLADLAELDVPAADVARADLLVPALHPGPMRAEANWGRRLAISAAIGGGAAMMLGGLLIPGALAFSGGLLASSFGRDEVATRERLLDTALTGVRRLGEEADRLLGDQLTQAGGDLERLGGERGKQVEADRSDVRQRLAERRTFHRGRAEALRARVGSLRLALEKARG